MASGRRVSELSGFVVIEKVSFRQHPLMQDPGDENAVLFTPKKHNMAALFRAAQARADMIARAARRRVISEPLAAGFQIVNISHGLGFAPHTQGVSADIQKVSFGKAG